ncbi:hypothetical protein NW762_002789 [Fusarium torreyae]|uniref:Uncharacterized protein n=1 Tax=Fusarium torreyae TaxID=1237075 RepID=A0A9W8SBZ7_9HYPO|nr:hypothetical protein NW762_002789 [Fusarium torreyae]
MRFFTVAALLFSSVALAAPAQDKPIDTACCCCDSSQSAIVCREDIKAEDCMCAAVMCPANAPTVWSASTSAPTAAAAAVKREEEKKPKTTPTPTPADEPCCCCNISKKAIVCEVREEGEDNSCVCPMVMCPSGAPTLTVYAGAEETGN